MNGKSKKLLIASHIVFFIPVITFFVIFFALMTDFTGLWISLSLVPGFVLYLITITFKRYFYKHSDDPTQRRFGLITVSIQCAVPLILEIICLIAISLEVRDILLRVIYAASYIPFLVLNLLFWLSFPKEEKKEV